MIAAADSASRMRHTESDSVFDRVVVGVDGSEPGFEACRQTAVLANPGAPIEAVSVANLAKAVHTGMNAPRVAEELHRDAEAALERAVRILGPQARKRFVNGVATDSLLHEIDQARATVLVLGTHGHGRVEEILIGGTAGELLHSAPCSVLVARPPADRTGFPSSIVVGVDGSFESDAALAAAQDLAQRFDAPLRTLVACRGKHVDLPHVRLRAPLAEELDKEPVKALVDASRHASILVVGSRGLRGLRALGSVSERVAHQAESSVLVVRIPREA